ncbi:hypothetical protein F4694_002670 [Bacillus niacini]|uniref:Glycosyl transferase n=1 Tax=Neobacillus niacini TaxID=86668 RepID=A0A852TD50_9BACI|nr:hypothetical protein [Neobacillus niacini]NYE05895.1 hypothetical protein [Neobacillus niacini]
MKILLNYADINFRKQQKLNSKTGLNVGGFDKVIEFNPELLGDEFYKEHGSFVANNKKGAGYWIWKPYLILKTLLEYSNEGDYIFYCDSGAMFINSVEYLIEALEKSNQEILLTEIPLLEYQWTKKECFIELGCEGDEYKNTNQIQGGFILIKNSRNTIRFFENFMNVCSNYKLISDVMDENINKDLLSHRHDQSLLSLLAKREKLEVFRDISQYGIRPWQYIKPDRDYCIRKYPNSTYPQIVNLFRRDNWRKVLVKEKIKDLIGARLRY